MVPRKALKAIAESSIAFSFSTIARDALPTEKIFVFRVIEL
jgi:hypothetical protein